MRTKGCALRIGPFTVCIQSNIKGMATAVLGMYGHYESKSLSFCDYHVRVDKPFGIRRWLGPQVNFSHDGHTPFLPLPQDQAFALFEWGLNWCISTQAHQYLIVHAAAVEKNGLAVVMPAPPGSGKSTLCAALVARGWRLLTDELVLVPMEGDLSITALPRPVSLKNQSIEVIKRFAPEQVLGPVVRDTSKGTVCHMRAPSSSIEDSHLDAVPLLLLFPKYTARASTTAERRSRAQSLMEVAEQSFNLHLLGAGGFTKLRQLLDRCDCYGIEYSDLNDVLEWIEDVHHLARYC